MPTTPQSTAASVNRRTASVVVGGDAAGARVASRRAPASGGKGKLHLRHSSASGRPGVSRRTSARGLDRRQRRRRRRGSASPSRCRSSNWLRLQRPGEDAPSARTRAAPRTARAGRGCPSRSVRHRARAPSCARAGGASRRRASIRAGANGRRRRMTIRSAPIVGGARQQHGRRRRRGRALEAHFGPRCHADSSQAWPTSSESSPLASVGGASSATSTSDDALRRAQRAAARRAPRSRPRAFPSRRPARVCPTEANTPA